MKINRIRASMVATLSFFIKNVYNRYIVLLAQWYTKLCTWRSRLATPTDTPTCIVIQGGQFTGRVIPQISSSLRLLVLCLFACTCSSYISDCLFFSKNLFLSSAPLTNATPAFSMLWFFKLLYWSESYTSLKNKNPLWSCDEIPRDDGLLSEPTTEGNGNDP